MIYGHDFSFLCLSFVTLILGSFLTLRLFLLAQIAEINIKQLWLIMSGAIGGGTIWSTHFIAMLAYESDTTLRFEPFLTFVSLVIVVATTVVGFFVASVRKRPYCVEFGGLIFGLGISLMHYTGIMAIKHASVFEWNTELVLGSIFFGATFGVLTIKRAMRPKESSPQGETVFLFCLAVGLMHYTGMSALSQTPLNIHLETVKTISREFLGSSVAIVMFMFFFMTLIASQIDKKNAEQSSRNKNSQSMLDPLTGLANRLGCENLLEEVLSVKAATANNIAVLSIDLDWFKKINAVHGHFVGDHMLRALSARIAEELEDGEVLGRFGGDEFLAIKSGVYLEYEALDYCNKILEAIRKPIFWQGTTFHLSASIGFSLSPRDGLKSGELIEKAGLALQRAEMQGRNCIVGYEVSLDQVLKEQASYAIDIEKAIEKGQFEIYYQLQNDTKTYNICGVEALLRWHHPRHGLVPPSTFIPIAEETGFITILGTWVLRQACREACEWSHPINISVNVAPQQICDPAFPAVVHEILLNTGLLPSRLELEITESGIIRDTALALHIIRNLKNLGVRIAIDDYGTGFSSLSTLQNFPIDKIKIDREFVKEIQTNKLSAAIVRSTVLLANSLAIPVIAEGAETEEQLKFLNDLGCQQVQGFIFGKPIPAIELQAVLESECVPVSYSESVSKAPQRRQQVKMSST